MEYDGGDSFPFDFESTGILFDWNSIWKLSPQSYSIKFERKWKSIYLSVKVEQKENKTEKK